MNAASLVRKHLSGNILGKAGPVPFIVVNIIIKELNDLRLKTDKAMLRSRMIYRYPDILQDGIALEDGLMPF